MEYKIGLSNSWKDISGNTYNNLTVLGYVGEGKWECKCICGKKKIIKTVKITKGCTISCGCIAKSNALKHGGTGTIEYNIWSNIKSRCYNSNNPSYKNYGGRGITMCIKWKNSFEQFFIDMGNCPLGFSIERKENNKGYCKNNCKWASTQEQSNNRRSNILFTKDGETKTLKQWCDLLNLQYKTVYARIKYSNITFEEALF